ncbi:glycosyltransferase family 2 protein [Granulicella sp. dw_53]|uniref:glycosyltransferase family 2 protein n=1 Tax=Granulicella sp. dw_53 TaxID=2719792 RepID=UPI001BD51A08
MTEELSNVVNLASISIPDVSVIIINWKSKAFVKACLTSIYANTNGLTLELFVVDNASFDGCREMLQSEYPDVIFIQCEHNLGFAKANNLAFARSRGHTILFLNPDTEVQKSAIQELVAGLESLKGAGMVGAHLLNSDLSVQTTCVTAIPSILNQTLNLDYLRRRFPMWRLWKMQALFQESTLPVQVEAISGACMLVRREVIDDVGAFSTDYFMYAEDMDLCLKVVHAGWKIFYIPSAKIVHHAGGSSSLRKENHFSNIMLRASLVQFFAVHRGKTYAGLYRVTLIFTCVLRLLLLVVASPLLMIRHRGSLLVRALGKWSHILVWSMGMKRNEYRRQHI